MTKRGRPPRPVPEDFEEVWPQVGWRGAEIRWNADWRTYSRWLDECGRERMTARRRAHVEAELKLRDQARRKAFRISK